MDTGSAVAVSIIGMFLALVVALGLAQVFVVPKSIHRKA
jgi:hypothetical protein